MNQILGNKKAYAVFVLPALIVYLLMVMLPIVTSGYYSTLTWNGLGDGTFVGIQNYIKMFDDKVFLLSARNSLLLAVLSVVGQLIPALALALILARGIKGEKIFRTIFFIPVVISTVVIGQLFLKIYNPEYGMLNDFITKTGIGTTHDWLGDINTVLISAFIPVVWQYIGYHMLLLYAAAKSIPSELYEAAKIDGASELDIAFGITIPLMKTMIKVCITFAIIGSLKFFDFIWILTKGGPIHRSEVPSTLMYTTIFSRMEYGYGSSIAIFIIIECLVFYFLIGKLIKTDNVA